MNPAGKGRRKRHPQDASPKRRGESGYTLLLALFFAAVMIIAASAALPNLITQSRRQKEKLLIWRGEQYARAIGLYYRKTGHFPHDLRELEKGVAGVHFLRQAYKDPMNSQDGSWRLIYLGAGGQLIGSLCWQTMAQYEAARKGVPVRVPVGVSGGSASSEAMGNDTGLGTAKEPTVPTCAMYGRSASSSVHPQIITEGGMVGGNLIGVASEVDASSIKNYMGADNYRYWEFIWSPQRKGGIAVPSKAPVGKKAPNAPGSSSPPGSPGSSNPSTSDEGSNPGSTQPH